MKAFQLVAPLTLTLLFALPALAKEEADWRFSFDHGLSRWQDGLPIGNGRIGAQCWGDKRLLRLTLDRSDAWDRRFEPNRRPDYSYTQLRRLVAAKAHDKIQTELTPDVNPLAQLAPTHVPGGRLEIALPDGTTIERVWLDMHNAEVRWQLKLGDARHTVRMYAHADQDLIVVEIAPPIRPPSVQYLDALTVCPDLDKKLGYKPPTRGTDGDLQWLDQPIPNSGSVRTAWSDKLDEDRWTLYLTIRRQFEHPDAAGRTLDKVKDIGPDRLLETHRQWWRTIWDRSSVELPDVEVQRLWRNGIYKLASSSHGGLPTNLQGLWPPDGRLPPWRGDYHCNMNVQECYWPAYSSNQLALAEPLNRWMIEKLAPANRELTKRFFGFDGLWIGCAFDADGRLLGGQSNWMTVQYWLGGGAWLSQHLWWTYRYSLDEDFLRDKAYPFMRDCMTFYANVLERGDDGRLHVPMSSSPEYYSNELPAWTADPTCDIALVRNLAQWCIQAAKILDRDADLRQRWRAIDRDLAPYPVSEHGLKVQPDSDFTEPHRHPMHLAAIFPLGDLHIEGSDEDRQLVNTSIDTWLDVGTDYWSGWSFPYASLILTRAGRANRAYEMLDMYRLGFIWPNGFHVNGDYKKQGFSKGTGTVFTVEGEMAFTAAVNEMLLQSWGDTIRVFPAVPDNWANAAFYNLRAEGAVLVSALRENGRVTKLTLLPEHDLTTTIVWEPAPDKPERREHVELSAGIKTDLCVTN